MLSMLEVTGRVCLVQDQMCATEAVLTSPHSSQCRRANTSTHVAD